VETGGGEERWGRKRGFLKKGDLWEKGSKGCIHEKRGEGKKGEKALPQLGEYFTKLNPTTLSKKRRGLGGTDKNGKTNAQIKKVT